MNKIVIIGSSGAGKSTLARNLHSILMIKVVHLDHVFWEPGWKEIPRETRIDILQCLVQEKQWIIEGAYLGASVPRLEASDTIIFLDPPTLLCLKRVVSRYMGHGRPRREIPEGCYDKLSLYRILKVLVFPLKGKIFLKRELLYYASKSKEIIWLRSSKEVEDFLTRLKIEVNGISKPIRIPSTPRYRQLTLARR